MPLDGSKFKPLCSTFRNANMNPLLDTFSSTLITAKTDRNCFIVRKCEKKNSLFVGSSRSVVLLK